MNNRSETTAVMPGLVPGIHVAQPMPSPCKPWFDGPAWMPTDQVRGLKAHGSSPAMTNFGTCGHSIIVCRMLRGMSISFALPLRGAAPTAGLGETIAGSRETFPVVHRQQDDVLIGCLHFHRHSGS